MAGDFRGERLMFSLEFDEFHTGFRMGEIVDWREKNPLVFQKEDGESIPHLNSLTSMLSLAYQ